jgi:hypothetical protein
MELESGDIAYWAKRAAEMELQRDELAEALRDAYDQIDCATGDSFLDGERRLLKRRISAVLEQVNL